MKELKAKQYYQLQASAIPDNKIQQVVGTYTATAYDEEIESQTIQQMNGIKRGVSDPQNLPPFSAADLTSTSTFNDVYSKVDVYGDGFDPAGTEGSRVEYIIASVTVDIFNDGPMSYISVETSNGVGITKTRTATSGFFTTLGWLINFDDLGNRIESIRNYNSSGGFPSSRSESSITYGTPEVVRTIVDDVYDGTRLYAGQYLLRVTFDVRIFKGDMEAYLTYDYSDPSNPVLIDAEGSVTFTQYESFDINVTYGLYTTEEQDFEYHVNTADYTNYPLKITGNLYTGENTTMPSNESWQEYIANNLLNMYADGKLWITAKVKASFLIDNNLDINSVVIIRDVSNNHITKIIDVGGTPTEVICTFSIKNIEYNYSGSEFTANLCLLEVGTATEQDRPIDNVHFFDLSIEEWESLTIHDMLIIYE